MTSEELKEQFNTIVGAGKIDPVMKDDVKAYVAFGVQSLIAKTLIEILSRLDDQTEKENDELDRGTIK